MLFTIVRKIWFCLLLLVIGYSAVLMTVVISDRSINTTISDVTNFWLPTVHKTREVAENFNDQLKMYQDGVVFGEMKLLDIAKKKGETNVKILQDIKQFTDSTDHVVGPVDHFVNELKAYTDKASVVYPKMIPLDDNIDSKEFFKREKLSKEGRELKAELNDLAGHCIELSNRKLADIQKMSHRIKMINILTFISVVCGTVFMALYVIIKSIQKPVKDTIHKIQEISKGDLSVRFNTLSRDELGTVGQALNSMIERMESRALIADAISRGDLDHEVVLDSERDSFGKVMQDMVVSLNTVIGELNETAAQVEAGSVEISLSSQSLADGALQQSIALKDISTSMAEIGVKTGANAENAGQASELAITALKTAKNGVERMTELSFSMTSIKESGKEITKIIEAIDSIAFQTNLLALNAAVEAARAGKHGKGFAVVAQEVRNLATRCAKAASESSELLGHTVKKVSEGSQVAEKTALVLNEIDRNISTLSGFVSQIAEFCYEQAQNISRVNDGLEKVYAVTQQNTSNSEETSAASEELSAQARHLRNIVDQFKLKKEIDKQIEHNCENEDHSLLLTDF